MKRSKKHWTQTPKGREKMRANALARHAAGTFGNYRPSPPSPKQRKPRVALPKTDAQLSTLVQALKDLQARAHERIAEIDRTIKALEEERSILQNAYKMNVPVGYVKTEDEYKDVAPSFVPHGH